MPQGRRPEWYSVILCDCCSIFSELYSRRFRVPAPGGSHTKYDELKSTVKELGLHTVCEEAMCPNIGK